MQRDAKGNVSCGPGHKEAGEAAVISRLIAQRLHQGQQVVAQLLIIRPLQHLYRMRPHLHPCQSV